MVCPNLPLGPEAATPGRPQGPIGMPRLKEPKTKYDDGILANHEGEFTRGETVVDQTINADRK